jgi:hypothetical protein
MFLKVQVGLSESYTGIRDPTGTISDTSKVFKFPIVPGVYLYSTSADRQP